MSSFDYILQKEDNNSQCGLDIGKCLDETGDGEFSASSSLEVTSDLADGKSLQTDIPQDETTTAMPRLKQNHETKGPDDKILSFITSNENISSQSESPVTQLAKTMDDCESTNRILSEIIDMNIDDVNMENPPRKAMHDAKKIEPFICGSVQNNSSIIHAHSGDSADSLSNSKSINEILKDFCDDADDMISSGELHFTSTKSNETSLSKSDETSNKDNPIGIMQEQEKGKSDCISSEKENTETIAEETGVHENQKFKSHSDIEYREETESKVSQNVQENSLEKDESYENQEELQGQTMDVVRNHADMGTEDNTVMVERERESTEADLKVETVEKENIKYTERDEVYCKESEIDNEKTEIENSDMDQEETEVEKSKEDSMQEIDASKAEEINEAVLEEHADNENISICEENTKNSLSEESTKNRLREENADISDENTRRDMPEGMSVHEEDKESERSNSKTREDENLETEMSNTITDSEVLIALPSKSVESIENVDKVEADETLKDGEIDLHGVPDDSLNKSSDETDNDESLKSVADGGEFGAELLQVPSLAEDMDINKDNSADPHGTKVSGSAREIFERTEAKDNEKNREKQSESSELKSDEANVQKDRDGKSDLIALSTNGDKSMRDSVIDYDEESIENISNTIKAFTDENRHSKKTNEYRKKVDSSHTKRVIMVKTATNVERVKRKLEEILDKSKGEEDAAIAELQKMKKEKTDILNAITNEMEKLKSILMKGKQG
ncbi:hypothetical protein SK128_002794 [Halocaridina rubra]|uniref:Uncharacterized protein n=1 Tax=Halocaridina rubra TaxID=373956 RepID=A0AAN8WDR3_HALRR